MKCVMPVFCLLAGALLWTRPAAADQRPIIFHGKVEMWDGTPPPKSVALERTCSALLDNIPGPLTNKEGFYTWRLEVDPFNTRRCYIRASMKGYTSTEVEISQLNGLLSTTKDLETIKLFPKESGMNPRNVDISTKAPKKARDDWQAAIEALNAGSPPDFLSHVRASVAAEPEFVEGWHTLGIALENQGQPEEARAAYQKAHELDPKFLPSYVPLGEFALRAGEWQTALALGEELAKQDKKRVFPDAYLFMAVAQFEMKDLDSAEKNALEALNPKKDTKALRAEYVLGRIYLAKGDTAAAKEHIERYLQLKPNAPDAALIQASLDTLGQFSSTPAPSLFN